MYCNLSYLASLSSVITPMALRNALVMQVRTMRMKTPNMSHVHQGAIQSVLGSRTITSYPSTSLYLPVTNQLLEGFNVTSDFRRDKNFSSTNLLCWVCWKVSKGNVLRIYTFFTNKKGLHKNVFKKTKCNSENKSLIHLTEFFLYF